LTFDPGREVQPTWSASGDRIAYWLQGAEGLSLMTISADGTGEAVVVLEAKSDLIDPEWSHDGRYLVYGERSAETGFDIRYVELEADGSASEPVTFLATPANEQAPKISPDGRFLAYSSDESGRLETYVRPFPGGDGKWQASVDGGSSPRWSRDGRELYYVQNATLISVSVSTGQGVALGRPRRLFRSDSLTSANGAPNYDVSPDGQRFITIAPVEQGEEEEAPPKIRIVLNWYEEFRNRER
jgi:eukaryotic-like serine/threonine-protein kinase